MTPPGKASLRRALLPAVIFALALAVRLHYLAGVEAYPRFEHVKNRLDDQVVFHLWASAIVAGERFDYATTGHEFAYWAAQHPGVYPQAPLYPFFVAACYRIFGSDFDLVRVVQMVLGAAACALFYLLARRWLTPVPAVLAALVAWSICLCRASGLVPAQGSLRFRSIPKNSCQLSPSAENSPI